MNILDFYEDDFTQAMQKALDSDEPELFLPAGEYVTNKPLVIRSNTKLVLDKNARIKAGDGVLAHRGDFLLCNRAGLRGDENITIIGGTWDGNYSANPKSAMYDENGFSGALVNFVNVRGLTLRDMTLHNASAYFTRLARLDGFTVEDIRFSHDVNLGNNDGVHLGGCCENGVIRRISCLTPGTTRDDLIALNADDSIVRTENQDLVRGYIRNVLVEDVSTDECHCLVRLLSVTAEISNVTIRNIRGGCRSNAINMDAARYCRAPLVALDDPSYVNGVGNIRNVVIDGMDVTVPSKNPLICAESNCGSFVLRNFTRAEGESPTVFLRNISPSRIQVRGLSDGSPDIDVKTDYGETFTLPSVGFDYFSIDTEDMN